MIVYGVALLGISLLVGLVGGELLGRLLGVDANVGGVGISMLLLLWLTSRADARLQLAPPTQAGISFWSAMYIPIVVAMAAKQNVVAALSGGWMALLAGALAVAASFACIPLLASLGADDEAEP
ncbi:MAG: malonate transporter subunit MadL [Pseudomonadota bacterium]